ncbi:hypothetical protein [Agromyces sp. NPDC058064]|uniref:hypothetical protein n=1 Tax=Agromyces sp. NPDC058064 TaxID=3346322 RepID=UPI0036DD9C00
MPPREEPRWHPILAAVETEFGVWVLSDQYGHEYGRVRIVRVDGVPRYRGELGGELLGYGGTLREACARVHQAWISAHGPQARSSGGVDAFPGTTKAPLPTRR